MADYFVKKVPGGWGVFEAGSDAHFVAETRRGAIRQAKRRSLGKWKKPKGQRIVWVRNGKVTDER